MFLQHTSKTISVPQHISRYGIYTGQTFLLTSILSHSYNYNWLSLVSSLLYVTTLLHWYKLKDHGPIKYIDIFAVIITSSSVSLYDSTFFCPVDRNIWFFSSFLCTSSYFVNKYIVFYQQYNNDSVYFLTDEPYRYFSLKYTQPNTIQRELSYKYSVYVHLFFLHLIISCACVNGVVNSPSCSNYYY
jgi:hypothetical protein